MLCWRLLQNLSETLHSFFQPGEKLFLRSICLLSKLTFLLILICSHFFPWNFQVHWHCVCNHPQEAVQVKNHPWLKFSELDCYIPAWGFRRDPRTGCYWLEGLDKNPGKTGQSEQKSCELEIMVIWEPFGVPLLLLSQNMHLSDLPLLASPMAEWPPSRCSDLYSFMCTQQGDHFDNGSIPIREKYCPL